MSPLSLLGLQTIVTQNGIIKLVHVHDLGSISAALSCLVYPPREHSGEERGLISRKAAGNRD